MKQGEIKKNWKIKFFSYTKLSPREKEEKIVSY